METYQIFLKPYVSKYVIDQKKKTHQKNKTPTQTNKQTKTPSILDKIQSGNILNKADVHKSLELSEGC